MQDLLSIARTGFDLLLVIIGFGLIIFIHELGHFLAAKWAGIRVLAFAIGFGHAAVSYRKGLGLRRGSSEQEYLELARAAEARGADRVSPDGVSPTEYRLNWLPLGGYVKMLGQDDLDPTATSPEKDSYQSTPVWKRMIVISAGVVFNVIAAAFLFIGVFMHGLETEPPIIGGASPGSAAAKAVAVNAPEAGIGGDGPGLKSGDVVLEVNGHRAREFTDLVLASAMSGRSDTVDLVVQRPGVTTPLHFRITPEESQERRLLELGLEPARSPQLMKAANAEERERFADLAARVGLPGLEPGMTLVRVNSNTSVRTTGDLREAVRHSGGRPVEVEFVGEGGKKITGSITPRAELQVGFVYRVDGTAVALRHLLGLTPVLRVIPEGSANRDRQGLQDNDIFARVGAVEFPSPPQGTAEVRLHKGGTVPVAVLRRGAGDALIHTVIDPPPKVQNKAGGIIGFYAGDSGDLDTLVALPVPLSDSPAGADTQTGKPTPTAAASIIARPGTRVLSVAGARVTNFTELRSALIEATAPAHASGAQEVVVPLELELPLRTDDRAGPVHRVEWKLSASDVDALHGLGWTLPPEMPDFEPASITLQADGPIDAIGMGIQKTHRVMVMTYLTFARLFEGTVKVEHLKGPVGIAHIGTRIAERGLVWLLFFMALISINLAVVNFLPLPIVDGGQFVFLLLEQVRGKPVSVEVQNVATVLGLVLIGAVFVIVTFNDIAGLFAG